MSALYALLFAAPVVLAEDPEFAGTDDAGQTFEEAETDLSAEVGATLAQGNSAYYTVNGLVAFGHRWDQNKFSADAGVNLGKSAIDVADEATGEPDGRISEAEAAAEWAENARRYYAEGRYDRFLGDKQSLYILAGAFQDTFAGYDLRSHEQVGYSRILIDSEATKLSAELGFDYAQEFYVEGVDPDYANIFAARAMVSFAQTLNENVSFTDDLEVYENVLDTEDLRVLNTAALTTRLSDTFSLKLSHTLTFDNVPVEGYRKLDHITMATLVASIF